jgi:hypothetical protein
MTLYAVLVGGGLLAYAIITALLIRGEREDVPPNVRSLEDRIDRTYAKIHDRDTGNGL